MDIHCEDQLLLLDVDDIDFMLIFDELVIHICKKTAQQLNVLLQLSKLLTSESTIVIYKSFIRHTFNYCLLVWYLWQ